MKNSPNKLKLPDYWDEACEHLTKNDKVLKKLIIKYEKTGLQSRGNAFETLARSIVGQQISVKAAQSIWNKFENLLIKVEPDAVLKQPIDSLRSCGLSYRKCEYLIDLSQKFQSKIIKPALWSKMSDDEIKNQLIKIKGIGIWTSEMFLIFHLMRPDILPLADLGLIRSISICYFDNQKPDKRQIESLAHKWKPYRTVATWYLWRHLDPIAVEY